MKELWVAKYRPTNLDGYVFTDEYQKAQIEQWIQEGSIPHLLFSGSAGVGKTTLAKILIEQLGVYDSDVLVANGSKEARKIEWVDKLISFCQTMPFGDFKVVLIDEADYMNCFGDNQTILVVNDGKHISMPISKLIGMDFDVVAYNLDTQQMEITAGNIVEVGEAELFEVEFEDGSIITCTKDHPFFDEVGNEKFISNGNLFSINNIDVINFVDIGETDESIHILSKEQTNG